MKRTHAKRRARHHGSASKSSIALAVVGLLALVLLCAGFARLTTDEQTVAPTPAASTAVTPTEPTPTLDDSDGLPPDGTAIGVPSVGLSAPLTTIRFEGDTLAPPEDVRTAGIWGDGAALSDGGTEPTVVTGHVSDDADRPGEFGKLRDVRIGDEVVTRDTGGRLRHWRVTERITYEKTALPRSLFLPGQQRVLHLITCDERVNLDGGGFHYSGNLVVTAVPID